MHQMQMGRFNRSAPSRHTPILVPHIQLVVVNDTQLSRPHWARPQNNYTHVPLGCDSCLARAQLRSHLYESKEWYTHSHHRETAHALQTTATPPVSTPHPLAFRSVLHAQPCRRHSPPEHRPPHWLQYKNSPIGERAKILFPPVRCRSGHQAPLVLAARSEHVESGDETDRKRGITDSHK